MSLLIAWLQRGLARQYPDLQQVHRVIIRWVEFAVKYAGTGRHSLHVARPDDRAVAHAVFVLQGPVNDVRDDLHVLVRVRTETLRRCNTIFIDDPQRTKAHPFRIVIVRKRKRVPGLEPAMIRLATGI